MASVLLACVACLVLAQSVRALGAVRGGILGCALAACIVVFGVWLLLPSMPTGEARPLHRVPYVTSDTCLKCHPGHYDSWRQSYHRTMTQEASPATVKGNFDNQSLTIQGIASQFTQEGRHFYMETADPAWARQAAASGKPTEEWGPPRLKKFEVARLVGSHWFQECMYRDEVGRYWRLPLSYHIAEDRWVHTNGAFLAPDTNDFWEKSTVWNESCVYCHNTKPSKRPRDRLVVQGQTLPGGYDTRVAELGIACEACHGPGEEHVRVNQDPRRRFALQQSGGPDPTIINPARLSAQRSSEVCGHCHGASVPRAQAWDSQHTDPYTAGDDIERFLFIFWSEAEQKQLYAEQQRRKPPPPPDPLDGRFWPDGTPLTTAVEYQGMASSKCFLDGKGQLSCLSCHTLHGSDPNFQLRPRMATNEACYQCHEGYRDKLEAHTHHRAESSGSLCYNCHMPHQVYSLLTTHRTHRIHSPLLKDSVGTGKPHACNLCHLDKSFGWTQEHLVKWYGHAPVPLSADEQEVAGSVLQIMQADARSRVVNVGAYAWNAAREASGTSWMPAVLLDAMERDRYPAVRYLAHRALRDLPGGRSSGYDYMGSPRVRAAQVDVLRTELHTARSSEAGRHPAVPLGPDGRLDPAKLAELLKRRNDPDVSIHE